MTHPVANTETKSRKRVLDLQPVPRISLTPIEAAAALGCSRPFFDEHILPELRVIRRSKLILIPVAELQKWAQREAARTLDTHRR